MIPSDAAARLSSACCTRSIVRWGTKVLVVGDAGSAVLTGTLDAVAVATASAAWASASSTWALARPSCAALTSSAADVTDSLGSTRSSPRGVDVADGGGAVGEQLAVAIEGLDVDLGLAAELLGRPRRAPPRPR